VSSLETIQSAKSGDKSSMDKLVRENTPLIWSVVRRFMGRGCEAEDLFQLGCIGFIKAVQGYDEDFKTQLSTYAVPKISGEVRRYLRDDGIIKVSRGLKEQAQMISLSRHRLMQELNRDPTVSEIAEDTGFTIEEIATAENATSEVDSLQRTLSENGMTVEEEIGVDCIEDTLIRKISIRQIIDKLPDNERQVLLLRYYKDMTQDSIARIIGVSQVQVSRLERRAVERMKKYFKDG